MFRERGRKGKRGRETSMQERNIDRFPLVRALTGDQTRNPGTCGDLLLCGTTPNQLSHTGRGMRFCISNELLGEASSPSLGTLGDQGLR